MVDGAIDENVVRHVAKLARLDLDEARLTRAATDLGRMIEHFSKLSELDTEGVEPTVTRLAAVGELRADEPGTPLPTAEALGNAPDRDGDFFRVPNVFG